MDILNIQKPILIDDVLAPEENLKILSHLSNRNFRIQIEDKIPDAFHAGFLNECKHVGMALVNYDAEGSAAPTDLLDPLFLYSKVIVSTIMWRLNAPKFKYMLRTHWNYYYKDQEGTGHIDKTENNFISILYNPHTTDGGTEILGKFYQDKMGQAKVFKSNWMHRGICVKKDKARSSLNIVLEY